MAKAIDIERVFDDQKIGSFHIKLLLISFLVMMTDGFDLGAAAYAGPGILKEWNLNGRELGRCSPVRSRPVSSGRRFLDFCRTDSAASASSFAVPTSSVFSRWLPR
jgi:hypothetical protein